MSTEKDKYDLAIDYLTDNPEEIYSAWGDPYDHQAGCLFYYATRKYSPNKVPESIGCLTQIRQGVLYPDAETEKLTHEIAADERIPDKLGEVTVDDLPVFAEWQRRLDKELAG